LFKKNNKASFLRFDYKIDCPKQHIYIYTTNLLSTPKPLLK